MKTLLRDSNFSIPSVRKHGHRNWFTSMAQNHGFKPSGRVHKTMRVPAQVNHGRWIAMCPFCNGAELVTEDDPVMMCLSCGNEAIGGDFLTVTFPDTADRRKIEDALRERPQFLQNWLPDETPKKIAIENWRAGLRVPDGMLRKDDIAALKREGPRRGMRYR